MGVMFVVVFFFGLLFLWVLLPFLPGLTELRLKTDARPLQVVRDSDVEIRHLSRRYRELVKLPLDPALDRCRQEKRTESGRLEDGSPYTIFGEGGDTQSIDPGRLPKPCRQMILSCGGLQLPPSSVHLLEIYSAGPLTAGAGSVFRAILCDGPVELGARSTTLRWLHAEGGIRTSPGCRLLGRTSADGTMRLSSAGRFERLNAPRIEFGVPREDALPAQGLKPLKPEQIHNLADARASRWLVRGKLKLAAGSLIPNDLVVTGKLEIGEGSRIEGSIKSHGDLLLSRGVTVTGGIMSERDIELATGCKIGGPIVAERQISIAAGCVLGVADRPSTVSAKRIRIAPGVVCHGTVWAHEDGVLLGPVQEALPLDPFSPPAQGETSHYLTDVAPPAAESVANPAATSEPDSSAAFIAPAAAAAGIVAATELETPPVESITPVAQETIAAEEPEAAPAQEEPRRPTSDAAPQSDSAPPSGAASREDVPAAPEVEMPVVWPRHVTLPLGTREVDSPITITLLRAEGSSTGSAAMEKGA